METDLVSRIEMYMEYKGVSRSQFADTCGIPRPTLTQLLNGHNKKVSDDLLKRIHSSYPDLSMMWLVFGEGDMLTSINKRFSEPEKGLNSHPPKLQHIEKEGPTTKRDTPISNYEIIDFAPEIGETPTLSDDLASTAAVLPEGLKTSSGTATEGKKIRHIMVFYTDNSYEIFTPSDKH